MQPRILIVYSGGTIGMTEDLSTGALVPFSLTSITWRWIRPSIPRT